MNPHQACPKCSSANPGTAKYCSNCGVVLAATLTQGRTVILPPGQPPQAGAPPLDLAALAARARTAFGLAATLVGVPPQPPRPSDRPEDTLLVADVSGSMGEEFDSGVTKIAALSRAAVNLVLQKHQIDPRDRVGAIIFNHRAEVRIELARVGDQKQALIRSLQALAADGGTDITKGLCLARDHFDWNRPHVVRRIVLLTDGQDDGDPVTEAEDLKQQGVVIDVIGIGASPAHVKEKLLKRVASTIEGELRYRFIKDHRTLVSHFTQLATKTSTSP